MTYPSYHPLSVLPGLVLFLALAGCTPQAEAPLQDITTRPLTMQERMNLPCPDQRYVRVQGDGTLPPSAYSPICEPDTTPGASHRRPAGGILR